MRVEDLAGGALLGTMMIGRLMEGGSWNVPVMCR